MTSASIPAHVAQLLWSVAPEALDLERSGSLIIGAVLARGEFEDAQWLISTYGRDRVREFIVEDVTGGRTLPRGARKLWAAILCPEIPRADLEDRPGERWGIAGRAWTDRVIES